MELRKVYKFSVLVVIIYNILSDGYLWESGPLH